MSDLISRQDAKDAIDMALDHIDHVPPWVYDKLLNVLNEVPSAEKAQLSGEDATKDATSDLIRRQDAIDAVNFGITIAKAINKETGDVIELFGKENEELRKAIKRIKDLPTAQPEIIRCGQCKYAEAADSEDSQDGYTCQFHRGSIWFSGSYCSWAERREECTP